MPVISTTEQLNAFCATLVDEPFVTLDTEFIREKTYYPRLCLVQVAGAKSAKAIDVLANGIDLSALYALLANDKILKVLHAGKQDVEIFFQLTGQIPAPIFDTQIAGMVLGFGESVSYAELIKRTLGLNLDKASRYTDWAHRPLSEKQIDYAIADVVHLHEAYQKIRARIEKENKLAWIAEELASLSNPANYVVEPHEAWKRLRTGNMRPKQLAALRELGAWREEEAKRKNLPRNFVVRDETLLEVAASLPENEADMKRIRGLNNARMVQPMLDAVARVLAMDASEYPQMTPYRASQCNDDLVELLSLLLKLKSNQYGVVPRMIATKSDLEQLAEGKKDVKPLTGWRYDMFGKDAEALIAGKLTICWDHANQSIKFA